MKNRFAVFTDTFFQRLMFEGSKGETYSWLMENNQLDSPPYNVIDRATSTVYQEGEFIRKFEEELKPEEPHKCLSEERIRTIVREELSKLVDAVRAKAEVPEYYDTEKMEDALVAVVEHISENKANDKVNSHEGDHHDGWL